MAHILVLEDDLALSAGLCFELDACGHLTVAAYHCEKARQLLEKEAFDLALFDVNLPDGSGLDLCQEIRGRGQRTYLMFLTANDREADILQGYEAGGGDYVTKPFSLPVLCRKIAAVFDHLDLHAPAATGLTTGCWFWTSPPRPPPWPRRPWTSPPRSSACWPSL